RGTNENRKDGDGEREQHEHEIIEAHAFREGERQAGAGSRNPGQSVVAAREPPPAEREAPQDLRERERDHEEIGSLGAQREQPEQRRGDRGHDQAREEVEPEVVAHAQRQQPDGVGAHAEIGGVAERRQAGIAEDQVQAHREDREDQHLGEQPELVRRERERQDDEDERARDDGDRPRHGEPKRPVGRTARMIAIGAKIVNIASSGKSAVPKLSSSPTTSPPKSAPFRLPSPPMMTTTNASSKISKSAPG